MTMTANHPPGHPLAYPLLRCLADGRYHSGNALAGRFAVSRTAIWKAMRKLRAGGIAIETRHGKGYRLRQVLDLLDAAEIKASLQTEAATIELHAVLDSTNVYLLRRLQGGSIHGHVVLCEYQSKGRGRRGRPWLSPLAGGLYLSIGWHFAAPPASLNALSLACGVALIDALFQAGAEGLYLKWPNDVIARDAKLAGILIESRSETASSCDVVIGIGVNIRMTRAVREEIDQPVIDLASVMDKQPVRSRLAAGIIDAQFAMLGQLGKDGAGAFIRRWRMFDYLLGRQAIIDSGGAPTAGVVRGVDGNGLLLMDIDGERRHFSSGELSLRLDTSGDAGAGRRPCAC